MPRKPQRRYRPLIHPSEPPRRWRTYRMASDLCEQWTSSDIVSIADDIHDPMRQTLTRGHNLCYDPCSTQTTVCRTGTVVLMYTARARTEHNHLAPQIGWLRWARGSNFGRNTAFSQRVTSQSSSPQRSIADSKDVDSHLSSAWVKGLRR